MGLSEEGAEMILFYVRFWVDRIIMKFCITIASIATRRKPRYFVGVDTATGVDMSCICHIDYLIDMKSATQTGCNTGLQSMEADDEL